MWVQPASSTTNFCELWSKRATLDEISGFALNSLSCILYCKILVKDPPFQYWFVIWPGSGGKLFLKYTHPPGFMELVVWLFEFWLLFFFPLCLLLLSLPSPPATGQPGQVAATDRIQNGLSQPNKWWTQKTEFPVPENCMQGAGIIHWPNIHRRQSHHQTFWAQPELSSAPGECRGILKSSEAAHA